MGKVKPITDASNQDSGLSAFLGRASEKSSQTPSTDSLYEMSQPAGTYFKGDSKNDIGLINESDQNEVRANNQSVADKWANGLVKMTGTAATTAAETFTSLPYGIAKSILSPDGKFSDIYDNEISRSYDALNQKLREEFPNYYTKEAQEQNIVQDLATTNFWADKVTNGLGFMGGAMLSGAGAAKIFSSIGKLSTASALGKTLNLADKGSDIISSLNKAAKLVKFTDGTSTLGASLAGAVGEAGMEARGIKDQTKEALLKQREDKLNNLTDEQIDDLAGSAGNAGFALNVAIVGASNFIQFGKLFSNYTNDIKSFNKIVNKAGVFEAEKVSKLSKTAKSLFIPAEEAIQEGSQFTTEKGVTDYYSKKNDPDAVGTFNDMVHSTLHGLEQTLGSKEGLESMLIGAILGGGGVPSSVKQNMKTDAHTASAVATLNQYKALPNVKAFYESAIRHTALQKDADKALQESNIFAYKNAQFDQFKNYVKSRIDADKFDTLTDELNDIKNLDKDEFIKTFGLDEGSDKVKSVNEFVEKLKTKASELRNINDSINQRFPNLNKGIKERMFDAASNLTDISRREEELSNQLSSITSKTLGTRNITKFPSLLNILNPFKDSSISTIEEDIKSSINAKKLSKQQLDKEIEQYIKTVNPLEGEKVKEIINDLSKLKERREDFIEKYNNLIKPEQQAKLIKKDEKAETVPTVEQEVKKEEIVKKATASEFYSANKEGFDSLVEFRSALDQLDKPTSIQILKSYKDLITKTLIKDQTVQGGQIENEGKLVEAKEIPEALRKYYGDKQYLDVSTGKAFDIKDTVEDTTIPEEVKDETPALDEVPPTAIKIEKFTPANEKPTIVNTQNTEFKRVKREFNNEEYVVFITENGLPVINPLEEEYFGTNFSLLSTPGTLSNGTKATLEIVETPKFTTKEAIIVKVGDDVVGKLSLTKTPLIEALKRKISEGKNEVTINGKWGSSALRTEKTDTSLNDIKSLSPQNLPEGKVIIGTIKGGTLIFPEGTKEEFQPNINNKIDGKHFQVLITPEGTAYPDMLWNTPVKDIRIGDKTVSSILNSKLTSFLTEVNKEVNKKDELPNVRAKWQAYRKENIDPLVNFSISVKETLSLDINLAGENYAFSLRKGKKEDKNYSTGKELAEDIADRFFNINSDLLEANQPFSFEGTDYPSYVDFLVDNKIVTTSLYPKRPFTFTELDIETNDLVNEIPDLPKIKLKDGKFTKVEDKPLQATEESKTEDPKKAAAREKLKKLKSKPTDTLTRPIGAEKYEHWNQEKELAWMKEVLPQIPVEVAKSTTDIFHKFGKKAHGIFTNATIYLAENTEVGTTYHEAYHAVENLYLSEKIIAEFNKTSNEEERAEGFRDFMMNEEIAPQNALHKFFSDIKLWIKNLFGLLQLNDIYNLIKEGKYANLPLTKNYDKFVIKTRLIPTFNATEQKKRLDVTMKLLFDELVTLQNSGNIISINFSSITGEQLNQAFDNVKDIWEVEGEESADAKKVFDNFDDFKKLALKDFGKYGLNVRESSLDKVEQEKEEQDSLDNTPDKIYSKAAFESSQKEGISNEVKLYLATVPEVIGKEESGEFKYATDDLGFTKFLDFHDIYNYLSDNLIGLETIDDMIGELEDLSTIKPELHKIIYDLKKNPSQENKSEVDAEKFRHKFFTTFSNQYIDFLTLSKNRKDYGREGGGTDKRYFFNIYETNKRSLQRQIVNNWAGAYEGLPHTPQVYTDFKQLVDKTFKVQLNTPDNFEGLNHISNTLKTVGITMSEQALIIMKQVYYKNKPKGNFRNYLLDTSAPSIGAILKAHHELGKNIYSGIEGDQESDKEIGERKAVNELAKFEKLVHVDRANASFLNGQNKTVYAINSNHYASKLFNRLKTNTDNIINNFLDVPYMKHVKLLNDLSDENKRKELKLYVFDTVFDNDSNFEGTSYDELDTLQSVAVKLNMFVNRGAKFGYFHIPTPSDRGNIQAVKLSKLSEEVNEVIFESDGTLSKNTKFYLWLMNAVRDEYARIQQVNSWDGTNPIKNYHVSKSGGKGNAYYFNQFYDLNKVFNLDHYYTTGDELPNFDEDSEDLHAALSETMSKQFRVEKKKLRDAGLIKIDVNGKILPKDKETKKLLDNSIAFDKDSGLIIDNYIANYYYSNTELTKILSGDIAYYKGNPLSEEGRKEQIADMNKRFGQSFVPGRDLSTNTEDYLGGAKEHFNLAISEDNELASIYITDYAKSIYEGLTDKEEVNFEKLWDKKGDFNKTEIYLRDLLGGYLKNNQTDAQGYTTLPRLRNIMEGQGLFTGKYKEAWERLEREGTDIKDFLTVFQPIKGFYYNQEFKQGLAVPTQVKYSTVPLIPSFIKNYPVLQNLHDRMKDSDVDEFVFESGIKAGVQNKNTIDVLATKDKLGFITLSNKNWRIPQIVPYKSKTKENFGSQIRKLITGNLKTGDTYNLFGGKKSGQDIKDIYQEILRTNIKEGYDKLIPEFNDVESVSKMLLEQIQGNNSRSLPETYEKALEYLGKIKGTRISLDFPLIKRKIENILNSLFDKKVVKQELPGFSAVQVSSFGVASVSNDLEFVRLEDGIVKPAEVLVSPQYFLNALKKQKINADHLFTNGVLDHSKISEDLLKVVLYRIPTQGKNSMLPARIKGFLPSESGSQIIIPFEVTTQAGSDYDIDKVYIEMYNFSDDLQKIQYDSKTTPEKNSKEARQNAIIDIHYSILTDPKHFAELITPNNSRTLKALKDEIEAITPDNTPKFWHNMWVQEMLRSLNQAGKQLVGVYSIQSTSHSIAQDLNMSMKESVSFEGKDKNYLSGQKNIDGNFISDDLSERQTAAVDNAKEPILGGLNDNKFTSSVTAMIIRVGFGNAIPSYFINQPIIRYLTSEYQKAASSTSSEKALAIAIGKAEERYDVKVEKDVDQIKPSNFTLKYLKEHIVDNNKNSKGAVHHKDILEAFIKYKDMGDALSRVSNALAIDTKGTSATIAENITNLNNLKDAFNSKYVYIDDAKYKEHSIHHYATYGVELANKAIKKYLPLDTSKVMMGEDGILTKFEVIKGERLTPEEINKIVYDFYTYLHTHPNSNFSAISNEFKTKLLSGDTSLSNRLRTYTNKIEKEKKDLNIFIGSLITHPTDKLTGFNFIGFNNTGSRTAEEKNTLMYSLLDLYNGNEEEHKLARDLAVYSFITFGFSRSVDTFIDYIPLEIYEKIGIIDFYKNISKSFDTPVVEGKDIFNVDNFIDQYVQNNFKELSFVNKVDAKDLDVSVSEKSINIWAGSNENSELSNMFLRSFTIDGVQYESVEHYFQLEKRNYLKEELYNEDLFGKTPELEKVMNHNQKIADEIERNSKNSYKVKELGRKFIGIDTQEWDKNAKKEMKKAIAASFYQNPTALKTLQNTGNVLLTHNQDKGRWKTDFPEVLMEVRKELFKNTSSINQDMSSLYVYSSGNRLYKKDGMTYKEINKLGVPNKLKEYNLSSKTNSIYSGNNVSIKEVVKKKVTTEEAEERKNKCK
jgi:predicted NAD-dependent protein-ADP-ribosyltransferase YbiA (DUF1768 family)